MAKVTLLMTQAWYDLFSLSQVESPTDDSSFSQRVYLAQLRPQIQPMHEQKLNYGTKSKFSVRVEPFLLYS